MIVNFSRAVKTARLSRLFSSGNFQILGIESSCDDTSAAVVNSSGIILGESHFSQFRIHLEAGGVLPNLATNLHRQYLKNVVESSLKQAGLDLRHLDAVAVTVKPGLILSLTAGLEYAKDLCSLYRKPMIPIHHMEAHALTGRITDSIKFPFLTLLISGGHSILAIVGGVDKFYTLGHSEDISPGTAMDKFARRAKLRNLKKFSALVGGRAIEVAALEGDPTKFPFTVSSVRNCNFSFSGILTAGVNYIKKSEKALNLEPDAVIPEINDLCASFQLGVAQQLCRRLEVAINYAERKELLPDEKCVVVSGGVASNQFIRGALKFVCDAYNYKMVVPPPKLCTDNGVMIAWNGVERLREKLPVVQPDELESVTATAKYPLGEDISGDLREVAREFRFKFIKLRNILQKQIHVPPENKEVTQL